MKDLTEMPKADLGAAAEHVLNDLRWPSLPPIWISCAAILVDLPILAVAFWFAQYAATPAHLFASGEAAMTGIAAALATCAMMMGVAGYGPRLLRSAPRALSRCVLALVLPVAIMTFSPPVEPASFVSAAIIAAAAALVPLRLGWAAIMAWVFGMRLLDRRAVVAGGGEHALALIQGLARMPENDIRICGIFDDRDDLRSPVQVSGVPKLGGYDDLIVFARRSEIEMVIVALPLEAERRISWLLSSLRVLPLEVRLSAFSDGFTFARAGRYPLISKMRHDFGPECRLTKRVFDVVFAALAIVPFAPIMLIAALAIRLESRGPIFFRQRRHGYNDRIIEVLKFRSMYHDQADPEARSVVTRGDPRVTRVGRFLRKSSIDELPQLFNVLKGDLSLVGPRPHAVDAMSSRRQRFERIVDGYSARHRLPPGITGWAQIHGWRGEIDDPVKLQARFEHDLHYIENWSLWLDLKILMLTPLRLFDTRSAY
ncbi:exopolysaccharide biosynthesis polyprenyl glycosylphosphotransferase [Palleronia sp. LCG004]|uniref:exopolysaccharide biosynthesis polyprenyl glycosylphosphotransferase n=1 Tax=Palleronia sp. LCG004 TaxID=3079304 RepID=UPI002942A40B|nr:exopolysaccharide biosynthesis polyprenyl glycosylphosphotransferase [Palleronia sp. LCG004]WOI56297.1 exopolysaccharide biosynthesis polyprenyl glycosylphosphotransferase [Palleronia sp. LCG004]